MSIHPSLRGANSLVGQRSVFTRVERLQKLMKEGKWSEEDSPYGLPKVRTQFRVKKKKAVVEDDAADGATDEAAGDAGDEASAE